MVNDKPLQSIVIALLVIGCAITLAINFTVSGQLAIFTLAVSVAISQYVRHLRELEQQQKFGLSSRDTIGLLLAAACAGVAWYAARTNNPWTVLILATTSLLTMALVTGNKARQTTGRIRLYYIGYMLGLGGLIVAGFSNFLPFSDQASTWLSAIGGMSLFVGLFLTLANEKATREYWQQQHNQQLLLDTTKADPFTAFQLKPDKLKKEH